MPDPFLSNPTVFNTGSYNPDKAREIIRGSVAIVAMAIFLVVVVFYLWVAARSSATSPWDHVKEAMQAVLPAVTSVLGTVLGFYFGSQKTGT